MAYNYSPIAKTAKKLIDRFGRQVTFKRLAQSSADPDRPWEGPVDPHGTPDASQQLTAVFATSESLGEEAVSPEMVRRSEQFLLAAPGPDVSYDLSTFTEVEDGGVAWKIQDVEVLRPGDTTILYIFGVKR